MNSSNIYLVESPLQILSAIEAASSNKDTSNTLIILYSNTGRLRNNQQMKDLIGFFDWTEVIVFDNKFKKGILFHLNRRANIKRIGAKFGETIDKLFIGDFRSEWMHYVRSVINPASTYLLDDGAVTINVQANYFANGTFWPKIEKNIKEKLKDLVYIGLKSDVVINKLINLFTMFDIASLDSQVVKRHSYRSVVEKFNHVSESKVNGIIFVGSKYSERGVISFESEISLLNKINKYFRFHYPDMNISYISHRDDSEHKLKYISDSIGFNVKNLDVPVELYLLEARRSATVMAGFYTTALLSANVMIPKAKIISFEIPSDLVSLEFKSSVSNIYKFISKSGIIITSLDQ